MFTEIHRSHLMSIIRYYEQSWLDYRFLWTGPETLSLHLGYWDEKTLNHSDSLLRLVEEMANRVHLFNGCRVIDLGCGIGGTAIWLASKYSAHVTGLNIVPRHLSYAKLWTARKGLSDRVRFVFGDFACVPLLGESFDVVWMCESLCHATDKSAVVKEASRLLKPGGKLIIAEYTRREDETSSQHLSPLQDWLTSWSIPGLETADNLIKYTVNSGFHSILAEEITENIRPSVCYLYRWSATLLPIAILLRRLKLRPAIPGNAHAVVNMWQALEKDLWTYSVITATKKGTPS